MSETVKQSLPSIEPTRLAEGEDIEFLRMIDDALDLGIAILDKDLRYQYLGKGMFKQLGLPMDTLKVGDSLEDCHNLMIKHGLLTPEILANAQLSAEEQRRIGYANPNRDIMRLANGTRSELKRKTLPSGHIVSMSYDVTQLVEKDEILEQSLRLGKAGYWTYDFKTKKYTLSETLKDYFSDEDLTNIGKFGILSIVHPEDRGIFREALRNISKTNDMFKHTCRTNTINGHARWNRTTGQVIRDPDGKPVTMRAFVKDVTEELKRQEELERAKDEAVAASHAKSEFLANMSHEIRTPMNGVLGMAELLANSDIDERQQEFVKIINSSATALLDIINDILDFSKIEAGALELDPVSFNLSETINDVVALLLPKAQSKGLELVIDYAPSLPRAFIGDAGRLRQVVTNLIGNAIKFTEKGHILLTVAVTRQADKNSIVSVSVKDSGIGIEKDKMDAVFKKFTQADGSTTRTYGGTGLGLSISKKIIELMGGRMRVHSVFGEGSTFAFGVPLEEDISRDAVVYQSDIVAGKRVLIVDDIAVNRQILSQQVEGWDMIPTTVRDGVEALVALRDAAATQTPFDLVLLDYFMPAMNGKEVAAIIAATDALNNPPVIILSSSDQSISTQEMNNIGVRQYLLKPVKERSLFQSIVKVLSTDAERFPSLPAVNVHKKLETMDAQISVPQLEKADIPTPKAPIKKIEVLVAEDFALNRDVVRLMLADSGFEPIFAENGEICVKMFTDNPNRFSVIVMDVSMPVMDGYEATSLIREFIDKNARPATPIIALTGHALKHDREKCLDAGMDDYLTKPVQQSQLIEKLEYYYTLATQGEQPARNAQVA